MSLVVRKIEMAKWTQNNISSVDDVSADAVTNCMKTKNNTLSVWEIPGEADIIDAVLAMASQFDHPDTIDIAVLNRQEITDSGLVLQQIDGLTPFKAFVEKHRDIVNLTYGSLGIMASLIMDTIRREACRRFTKGDIKRLVNEAVSSGRIAIGDLKDGMKKICV